MSFATRLCALLALVFARPTVAHAQDVTSSVRVKRIAVGSPADAHALKRRIADAALSVCGARDGDLPDVRAAIRHSACYADAMTAATTYSATAAVAPVRTGERP